MKSCFDEELNIFLWTVHDLTDHIFPVFLSSYGSCTCGCGYKWLSGVFEDVAVYLWGVFVGVEEISCECMFVVVRAFVDVNFCSNLLNIQKQWQSKYQKSLQFSFSRKKYLYSIMCKNIFLVAVIINTNMDQWQQYSYYAYTLIWLWCIALFICLFIYVCAFFFSKVFIACIKLTSYKHSSVPSG